MSSEIHPWARADAVVSVLRCALARWRGTDAGVAADAHWYRAGASGQPSREVVSLALSVAEAETVAQLLVEELRAASR